MPLRDTPTGQLGMAVASILKIKIKQGEVMPEAAAANARISLSQLNRILSGERPMNIDQLDLMAASLGLTPSAILAEAEGKTPDRTRDPSTYAKAFKQKVHEKGF